jgi:hypothetical protein
MMASSTATDASRPRTPIAEWATLTSAEPRPADRPKMDVERLITSLMGRATVRTIRRHDRRDSPQEPERAPPTVFLEMSSTLPGGFVMGFRVVGLPASRFEQLYGLSEEALAEKGIRAYVADSKPGFPCRVSLRDAEPGERVLLLNFEHQPAGTPYRSAHAIYVKDGAQDAEPEPGEVPEVLRSRLLSVRAFDGQGMMVDADLADGREAGAVFERLLANPAVAYLHVHNAKRGCYAARVDRA